MTVMTVIVLWFALASVRESSTVIGAERHRKTGLVAASIQDQLVLFCSCAECSRGG